MSTTRRRFLQAASTGGAVAGIAGFSLISKALTPLLSGPDDGLSAFQPPEAAEIDDATHILNRLTFGPRPGQRMEILQLGTKAWMVVLRCSDLFLAELACCLTMLASQKYFSESVEKTLLFLLSLLYFPK